MLDIVGAARIELDPLRLLGTPETRARDEMKARQANRYDDSKSNAHAREMLPVFNI
jgi:hypothetical protein